MYGSVGFIVFSGLALCCAMPAQETGFDAAGVQAIGPADAAFANAAKALNASSYPGVTELLPYSLVIENHSSRSVVMYAVHLTFKSPGRARDGHSTMLWSALIAIALHGKITPEILPGTYRPVSELFTLGPGRIFHNGEPEDVSDYISRHRGESVKAELDAVVFADGEFVGPDRGNSYPYIQGRFAARHDVYAMVMRDLQAGLFPVQTMDNLARAIKESGDRTPYDRWVKEYAEELLRVINAREPSEAVEIAREGAKYPILYRRGAK
jgi:hypothetical protein